MHEGTPDIKVAGSLAFAPDGTLIVGDSPGSALFALDVHDDAAITDTVGLKGVDVQVAARLGTTATDISINGMAVHPRTHAVYLSVSRGLGNDSRPAIVRIGSAGRIDVVPLANMKFAKVVLPHAPAPGQKDDDGDEASASTITDLAIAGGAVYIAGLTNEEFASTLRRVPIPFTSTVASTGLRVFHAHHRKFETKSPVSALTPYRAGGRDYMILSYACTPLALLPLDSLVDGAKVTPRTIAELGAGTHATNLVTYTWENHRYLAVATIGRSIQLLLADSLDSAPALTMTDGPQGRPPLAAWHTWGVPAFTGGISGVVRLADFNAKYAVALQRAVTTGELYLRPLEKPIMWSRSAGS